MIHCLLHHSLLFEFFNLFMYAIDIKPYDNLKNFTLSLANMSMIDSCSITTKIFYDVFTMYILVPPLFAEVMG